MPIQHPSFGTLPEDRVIIFDTTLRDGEQSPGVSMNLQEKLRMAEALAELGVDVMEAGFPIASPGDFEAVQISRPDRQEPDHRSCPRRPRRHRYAPPRPSPAPNAPHSHLHLHLAAAHEAQAAHGAGQGAGAVTDSVPSPAAFTDDVEWSAEDGSRTEHDFLCRCVEAAIKAGARTINIPDTVGYALPQEYAPHLPMLGTRVPNIEKPCLLRALPQRPRAGDRQLARGRCLARRTASGMHHQRHRRARRQRGAGRNRDGATRAARRDACTTAINTENIPKTSQLLASITGFDVQPNKAIVGATPSRTKAASIRTA